MRYLLLLWLLLSPGLLQAAVVPAQGSTSTELLAGFVFGQGPDDAMLCFKGPCLDELNADQPPQSRTIVSSYKKLLDVTYLAGVEISSPRYDFHDDTLFRVSFSLLCSDEDREACIAAVADDLQQALGLSLSYSYDDTWQDDLKLRVQRFSGVSGISVRIDMRKLGNNWEHPFVEISDQLLMDQVRLAANPDYLPK